MLRRTFCVTCNRFAASVKLCSLATVTKAHWRLIGASAIAGALGGCRGRRTRARAEHTRRSARVAFGGAIHDAAEHAEGVLLADGRVLAEAQVVWLPPFAVGTIVALGINYADHAKELAQELTVGAMDEPLAFLKAPNTLIGHRGFTRRPRDATFMHYECELAVVIGTTAKKVKRADALHHVAGYTVANDYAIRDYLENWYRPNLRIKNRDPCTALGPWFVTATDVPDPHVDGIGRLVNTIVGDELFGR